MISATASQEGPPAPHRPPPSAQQPPRPLQPPPVTHHALTPHHALLHPPTAPSTMAQLPPLPLPLTLPHPLYPHHQLGPPPHPYHPLHPHHHHHHHHQHQLSTLNTAAAAAAMIAFDHHHGRHHLTPHLLGTPPSGGSAPPPSTERSPSPPRFLRPPPPSRPVPNHLVPPHATAPSYNGVRSPERGPEGGGLKEGSEDRLKEGSEAVEMCRSEEDGGDGGAVNLVHKRIASQEDPMCAKRSRMVNGGLGGRANALGSFVPHSMYPPPASPYFPASTSSTAPLLSAPYSPTATSPSVLSPYSLHTSPSKHPSLHLHPYTPHASPPRHSPDHAPLPPSAPIAPTFTSPAITVGPITTPTSANFSYDAFFPSSSSPVKPGQSVLRRPSLPPATTSVSAPRLSLHHFPPPLPSAPAPASSPPQPQPQHPSPATAFKIPSGKEGSLKHRLLPPRSDGQNGIALGSEPQSPTASCALFKASSSAPSGGKRRKGNYAGSKGQNPSTSSSSSSTSSTPSPPGAKVAGQQTKGVHPSSNASSPPSASRSPLEDCFSKGSLIRLRGGRVVRVEELKTEDFVRSAEGSDAIRLDPSTVVALEERPEDGTARLTLAYGSDKLRSQVELESTLEQPFFVVGRGWASVCPERSLRRFGLSCLPLRIGHVCISLTERPNSKAAIKEELPKPSPFEIKIAEASNGERKQAVPPTPFVTTSCNTSNKLKTSHENLNSLPYESKQAQSGDLKPPANKSLCSPESSNPCDADDNDKNQQRSLSPASRKRRWSAPGPLSNEEDEEEKTKSTATVHPQQNSSGVASHHNVVES